MITLKSKDLLKCPVFVGKIKGDAGVYFVWSIDWLHRRILFERACGDEWVEFEKVSWIDTNEEGKHKVYE